MTGLRVGSLCSGYGGLDLAVVEVLAGSVAWHCQYDPDDRHQYAARILEHHWPEVPNHGDITSVNWAAVEPIDVLTAGFPCQDLSYAGRGAGIKEGTRSGLWYSVADAIDALRPGLVVLENVGAIVSRRPGLDVVLASLADVGFDAEWRCVRASDVGAPHQRERWFLLAWPADPAGPRFEGERLRGRPAERRRAAADADDQREYGRGRPRRESQRHAAGSDRDAADTSGDGWDEGGTEPAGLLWGSDAAFGGDAALADASGCSSQNQQGNDRAAELVPELGTGDRAGLGTDSEGDRGAVQGAGVVDWRQYGPAVARWEHVLGRPAPCPVDDRGRLSPLFVEWMMGLPEGHVCDVPAPEGMSAAGLRNARLKALGNGVVRQQAAYALRLLLDRMGSQEAA